ncbi:MAG: ubiquinol-cytochrome c reductase iron-sulfur subunit [Acidimicrobiales bacterium]
MSATGDNHGEATPVTIRLDADQYKVAAANPRQVEWGVAVTFLLGLAGFMGFGAAYWVNASNAWLGLSLGVGFLGLGVGMVAWGKYLMPRGPFSESRHSMVPTQAEKDRIIEDFSSRGKVVVERRTFLTKILGAAGAVFGVVVMFPLIRSLGPLPKSFSQATTWHKDSPLVRIDGTRVHIDAVEFGGMLTVFPEGDAGGALSQTMLVRQQPPAGETNIVTAPGRETWSPLGYMAFSKVCTHAGCPIGLYQQQTHQLLCPCHQSLFDVGPGKDAQPVFGPAPRPLPQLPLYVDSSGFLRAQAPYDQPVGPSFWWRRD